MNNTKRSITRISIFVILTALLLTGCSSVEQEHEDQYKFNLKLEQTATGKTVIKEQKSLIQELEKALLFQGVGAQISNLNYYESSVNSSFKSKNAIIIAKDKNGTNTYGLEVSEPDINGKSFIVSTVDCFADNCQSDECIPVQTAINGSDLVWTCSDFEAPCKCKKETSAGGPNSNDIPKVFP